MFKVNDTVKNGYGQDVRIVCTDVRHARYPILGLVRYSEGKEEVGTYTAEGLSFLDDSESEENLVSQTDWSKVAVDTPVWVRSAKTDAWKPRHFSHVFSGEPFVFQFGQTSHTGEEDTTKVWRYTTTQKPEGDKNV